MYDIHIHIYIYTQYYIHHYMSDKQRIDSMAASCHRLPEIDPLRGKKSPVAGRDLLVAYL